MALFNVKFLASSVMMQMHLLVFLPESIAETREENVAYRTLWLLHPERGDCSDWIRLAGTEKYAERANIALVMPNMDNSMYMDMAHGAYPYFSYLTGELPEYIRNLFSPLSRKREDNFVAGVSAGGYGAVKWALRTPGMFASCACLSGDIDIVGTLEEMEKEGGLDRDWEVAFGGANRVRGTVDDTLDLCEKLIASGADKPAIHTAAAPGEKGFGRRRDTAASLRRSGLNISFAEGAFGGWDFWDGQIEKYIDAIAGGER